MLVLAVEPAGRADVYDLTVEGAHEFYAEGVLVHNSRYGICIHEWQIEDEDVLDRLARMQQAALGVPGQSRLQMALAKMAAESERRRIVEQELDDSAMRLEALEALSELEGGGDFGEPDPGLAMRML